MITSISNPLIKKVIKLQQKSAERKKTGLFVAEGRREVSLALKNGTKAAHLLICSDIYNTDADYPIDIQDHENILTRVSRAAYNRMAYRGDAEGVILVGQQQSWRPEQLVLPADPLVLVLEGIEKPGNIGAIMRTADAAGVDALVLAGARTDIYNPNVIRSSLGCIFSLQLASATTEESIAWVRDAANWPEGKKPTVVAASLQANNWYFNTDMKGPAVLLFGTEDEGLSSGWNAVADKPVKIPMLGDIDSLNVSVSVAILTYEAVRQRHGS